MAGSVRNLLALLEAEEAGPGSDDTVDLARLRKLLKLLEEKEAGQRSNNGTLNSFNNKGGNQNFSNAKINSGAYSGDGNGAFNHNNYGGSVINNGGTSIGHGNGSIIGGNFDASRRK